MIQDMDSEATTARLFSELLACADCGISLEEIEPRSFSFNNPHGACPDCTGLGTKLELDPDLVIPNRSQSLSEGAVQPWARSGTSSPYYYRLLESAARHAKFSMNTPIEELTDDQLRTILYGLGDSLVELRTKSGGKARASMNVHFEGVIPNLKRRHKETSSEWMRAEI